MKCFDHNCNKKGVMPFRDGETGEISYLCKKHGEAFKESSRKFWEYQTWIRRELEKQEESP